MIVTLEIPPDMEAILSRKAELFELSLPEYLFSLAQADTDDDYSLSPGDIESVQQGLAELAAGDKGVSLEEMRAEMMATLERSKKQPGIEAAA